MRGASSSSDTRPTKCRRKSPANERAAGRVTDLRVLQVGDGGVEVVLHVRGQRQVPGEFAGAVGRGEVLGDGVVVAHDAGVTACRARR